MERDNIMNSNDENVVKKKNYNNNDRKKTDDDLLSTSPNSVTTDFLSSRNHSSWKEEREDRRGISLTEFVENIPEVLRSSSTTKEGENNELDIDAVSNFFQ